VIGVCSHESHALATGIVPPTCSTDCGTEADPYFVPEVNGAFTFTNPTSGEWYDPPSLDAFDYDITGGTFKSVTTPSGGAFPTGPVDVIVGGIDVDSLSPGGTYDFGAGVTDFLLEGIYPAFSPSNPDLDTAYPVGLTFNSTPTGSLVITPESIPEPLSLLVFGTGLGGLTLARRLAHIGGKTRPA
jgi:hypothetical protein